MPGVTAEACAESIAGVLRRHYGRERHAAKRLARTLDTTQHAVKAWFGGKNAPSLAKAILLAAECDAIAEEFLRLIQEARQQKCANSLGERSSFSSDAAASDGSPASSAAASGSGSCR